MKEIILKPCPFCGETPTFTKISAYGSNYAIFHKCANDLDVTVHKDRQRNLEKKWNSRK
jgi:hypothetical protein